MKTTLKALSILFLIFLIYSCDSDSNKIEPDIEMKSDDQKDTDQEGGEKPTAELAPVCLGTEQPTLTPISSYEPNKCGVFIEENGVLIMEAESTNSDLNIWSFHNEPLTARKDWNSTIHETVQVSDHKGSGYIRYNGAWKSWEDPVKVSPLKYTFKIKNSGEYKLFLRAFKKLNEEGDKHNDCFIRMEGDFTVGQPNTCIEKYESKIVLPSSKLGVLKKNTNFFGAANVGWVNNGKLDVHNPDTASPHYNRPWAMYHFEANQTYTLTITGRSTYFHIDRILLIDLNKYSYNNVNDISATVAESICE